MSDTRPAKPKGSEYRIGTLGIVFGIVFTIFFIAVKQHQLDPWLLIADGQALHKHAFLVRLIAIVSFAVPVSLMIDHYKRKLQPQRDAGISADGTFAVFLRTFTSDTKVRLPNPYRKKWAENAIFESSDLGPEEFVGRVLEPYLRVLEVGGGDTIGPGRIRTTDDEWKNAVSDLCHRALLILVLPIPVTKNDVIQSGHATMWELEHLAESGGIGKAVFIMPPCGWLEQILGGKQSYRSGWELVRTRLIQHKVDLPCWSYRGGVVTFRKASGNWVGDWISDIGSRRQARLTDELLWACQRTARMHGVDLGIRV